MLVVLGVLFHLTIIDFTILFEINIILIGYEKIKAENSKVVFRTIIAKQLQVDITKDDI